MGITKTWVVVRIGDKKYAINSSYVNAITELKHTSYIRKGDKAALRGIYDVFSSDIPVIDGYKIARETSKNQTKLAFSQKITKIRIQFMAWIDCIDCESISFNDDKTVKAGLSEELHDFIKSETNYGDEYLNRIEKKIKENMIIQMARSEKMPSMETISDKIDLADNIRRESERYVLDALDNLIEAYTGKLSEMCLVVTVKEVNFGITIDSVELIADMSPQGINKKASTITTAIIDIKGNQYEVLDLTKLRSMVT